MKEFIPIRYGLYRIIVATSCFIFVFFLQFFDEFAQARQLLQQGIADNSVLVFVEEKLYEFIDSAVE